MARYKIVYLDELSNEIEKHYCNWNSELSVIVSTGVEKNYIVMVERVKKK